MLTDRIASYYTHEELEKIGRDFCKQAGLGGLVAGGIGALAKGIGAVGKPVGKAALWGADKALTLAGFGGKTPGTNMLGKGMFAMSAPGIVDTSGLKQPIG